MATWAAGLVAPLMLVIMAAGLAAKRQPKLVAKSVLVASAVASLAGIAFVVTFPEANVKGAGLDRGAWLFLAGVVLAIAAAVWVLRPPVPPAAPAD
jgi:hypothetical protein